MMKNPHFSIIVPVYKTEAYLARCVESIRQQDFEDFELILVNDGSPDNCPKMCDEFAKQDPRITVVHQENAGVSAARNAGLAIAKGEWVWFVDSDDYIKQGALSILSNYRLGDLYIFESALEETFSGTFDEFLQKYYFSYKPGFAPWNKLYKREIISLKHLQFDTEETIGEDLLFNLHFYQYCHHVRFINGSYYVYDDRDGSAMNSQSRDRHVNQMRLFRKTKELLQNKITPLNLGILYFMHLVSGLNQSALGGVSRRERSKLAHLYRRDFPGDSKLYKQALTAFLRNEQASFLGKLNLKLLLSFI